MKEIKEEEEDNPYNILDKLKPLQPHENKIQA